MGSLHIWDSPVAVKTNGEQKILQHSGPPAVLHPLRKLQKQLVLCFVVTVGVGHLAVSFLHSFQHPGASYGDRPQQRPVSSPSSTLMVPQPSVLSVLTSV